MANPTLRFLDKDGMEWEQMPPKEISLSDVAYYVTKTRIGTKSEYVRTENMLKDCGGVVFDDSTNEVKGIDFHVGDILVSNIRPYLKKAWLADRNGICSTDVLCIRPKEGINPKYLFSMVGRDAFFNYMMQAAKGSKMPRGDKEYTIEFPLSYTDLPAEQQKIATFFGEIDELIDATSGEIEALEQQKKALMQKIFSQEVRFKKDDGTEFPDWEEHEIGDYLEKRDERQIPTDDAPLMAFIAYQGVADKGERYDRSFLVKHDDKQYKRTEYNDFIYSSNNLDVGSIGLNKYGSAVISIVYEIFKVKDTAIPDFISELIQTPRNISSIIRYRQGALYGQYKIFAEDFLSVKVGAPCIEEQQKIADCLSGMDDLISSTKDRLEGYKQLKKGLMQRMFL